jgi:muramoyltetrapeptide carboxypeptidase LdcA involved in peptidoglycan recycling
MPAKPVVPRKLRPGDEIRVIAPSRSMAILTEESHHAASAARLAELGIRVTFGARVRELDDFGSSSVASRVADLHEAFLDPSVRGVLTVIGGFNANQLLRAIDWDLIAKHPKVFCGYSDITALQNAMLAKSNLVTYSGPHFSTLAMTKGLEYTLRGFARCAMEEGPFDVEPSREWSDDRWFLDQENRTFHPNAGPVVLRAGVGEGTIVGGNLCTLNLLQGTEWMPSLDGAVVFVEEDAQAGALGPLEFDRNLQSLLHQPGIERIAGLAIGRFQPGSNMTLDLLRKIVETKTELARVPVACGFDFGHTTPHMTFPVGGRVRLDCAGARPRLTVLTH